MLAKLPITMSFTHAVTLHWLGWVKTTDLTLTDFIIRISFILWISLLSLHTFINFTQSLIVYFSNHPVTFKIDETHADCPNS